MRASGELAGLLAEVKSLSPEELRRIEAQVAEFHSDREASEKARQKVEAKWAELDEREHQHQERMRLDLETLNHREGDLALRETNVKKREDDHQTSPDACSIAFCQEQRIYDPLPSFRLCAAIAARIRNFI